MSVDVSVVRTIDAPVSLVESVAVDPATVPRWYAKIDSAVPQGGGPLRVGSVVDFRARFLGRSLVYAYEVTAWERGRRFEMRTASGPFPMRTEYLFEERQAGGGAQTVMTLRNSGEPTGFSKLVAPFIGLAMRQAMTKDLAALDALVQGVRAG
ncbi:MAG: SRPBCC family protein [Segniliparus sp.]|uniref:SRPBCC family protein n=1 Tax=Segniliparus sp. TaxID=2804064 RepID=UPI003F3C9F41